MPNIEGGVFFRHRLRRWVSFGRCERSSPWVLNPLHGISGLDVGSALGGGCLVGVKILDVGVKESSHLGIEPTLWNIRFMPV